MESSTIKEIVLKLIGPINPVGATNADTARFENLETLCKVVYDLLVEIDNTAYEYKDRPEASVKKASEYAKKFITQTLGIKD
jgi:hypothetical protein